MASAGKFRARHRDQAEPRMGCADEGFSALDGGCAVHRTSAIAFRRRHSRPGGRALRIEM